MRRVEYSGLTLFKDVTGSPNGKLQRGSHSRLAEGRTRGRKANLQSHPASATTWEAAKARIRSRKPRVDAGVSEGMGGEDNAGVDE